MEFPLILQLQACLPAFLSFILFHENL
uniref:Uncharacterized protein n=1 Tax=Rhizophora mucronata TaxID=61149 RepID=A0A2P2N796_RHIMU